MKLSEKFKNAGENRNIHEYIKDAFKYEFEENWKDEFMEFANDGSGRYSAVCDAIANYSYNTLQQNARLKQWIAKISKMGESPLAEQMKHIEDELNK